MCVVGERFWWLVTISAGQNSNSWRDGPLGCAVVVVWRCCCCCCCLTKYIVVVLLLLLLLFIATIDVDVVVYYIIVLFAVAPAVCLCYSFCSCSCSCVNVILIVCWCCFFLLLLLMLLLYCSDVCCANYKILFCVHYFTKVDICFTQIVIVEQQRKYVAKYNNKNTHWENNSTIKIKSKSLIFIYRNKWKQDKRYTNKTTKQQW